MRPIHGEIAKPSHAPARSSPRKPAGSSGFNFAAELEVIRARGPIDLAWWAARISVTVESLVALEAVELDHADLIRLHVRFKPGVPIPTRALGYPERDAARNVVTIAARADDEHASKGCVAGAPRGLVIPCDFEKLSGPGLSVEGFSDVVAAHALGLAAVGRCSNAAGSALLLEFLRGRDPIIVGENDRKPNGDWPGRDGMRSVSKRIAEAWKQPVRAALPPGGSKDVRAWLVVQVAAGLKLHDEGARLAKGRELLALLEAACETPASNAQPLLLNGATIEPTETDFLWFPVIALGKLTIVAGVPSVGKSTLCYDLAARVTRGEPFPLSSDPNPRGSVLVLSNEEDPEDEILPRFILAGGDPSKVEFASDAALAAGTLATVLDRVEGSLPTDLRLVVIDSLSSSSAGIDLNTNDATSLLAQARAFAKRHRVAVLVIAHFSKSAGRSPLNRVSGSVGIGALARSVWIATRLPDDSDRCAFVFAKTSLAKIDFGYTYRIERVERPGKHPRSRLVWDDHPFRRSADEILAALDAPESERSETDRARDWLNEFLRPGDSKPSPVILEAAKKEGISPSTLHRATKPLGINTRGKRPGGLVGPVHWTRAAHRTDRTTDDGRNTPADTAEPPILNGSGVPCVPTTAPTEGQERDERKEPAVSGDSDTNAKRSAQLPESNASTRGDVEQSIDFGGDP